MKIHALVEGKSEKIFLEPWFKRLLREHELRVYTHSGKGKLSVAGAGQLSLPLDRVKTDRGQRPDPRGLLDQLPAKLRAFGKELDPARERVFVLVDADNDDVPELTKRLASLVQSIDPAPVVAVAVAVEELEAFYLSDLKALAKGFPDFDRKLAKAYIPDSICGTWELFGQIIGDGGGNKVAWAKVMGPIVTTKAAESRSPSFKTLCKELSQLATAPADSNSRAKKHWRSKTAITKDRSGKRQW